MDTGDACADGARSNALDKGTDGAYAEGVPRQALSLWTPSVPAQKIPLLLFLHGWPSSLFHSYSFIVLQFIVPFGYPSR